MRFLNEYRGSSFLGLVKAEHPDLAARLKAPPGDVDLVHGTTICAIEFEGGVLLGGDRRATLGGGLIMNEEVTKVFKVDDHSAIAIAGTFGPAVKMARLLGVELEHYEKIEGTALTLGGKANKLAQMIEMNFPAAMQGMVVMPLFVGYDLDEERAAFFEFDITGGIFSKEKRSPFATTGSGGERARTTFEHFWKEGMTEAEAVALLNKALAFAAKRDTATGGTSSIIMSVTADGVSTVSGENE